MKTSFLFGLAFLVCAAFSGFAQAAETYAAVEDNGAQPIALEDVASDESNAARVTTSSLASSSASEEPPPAPVPSRSKKKKNPAKHSPLENRISALEKTIGELEKRVMNEGAVTQSVVSTRSVPPSKSFEPVPADQVTAIAGRMKIAEQIMVQFGRAYDYRALTTRELQGILDQLKQSHSNSQGT